MAEASRRRGGPSVGRGASTVVNYVLMLAVLAVLVSVIVTGTAGYVEDRRSEVTRSELDVVANRLAADLTTADALARAAGPDGKLVVRSPLPEQVARRNYRVAIDDVGSDTYRLTLDATGTDVTASATLTLDIPLRTGTYSGGELLIARDPGAGRLEVAHG